MAVDLARQPERIQWMQLAESAADLRNAVETIEDLGSKATDAVRSAPTAIRQDLSASNHLCS
jgi:hypothetical protein